jgi:hypothetical protein
MYKFNALINTRFNTLANHDIQPSPQNAHKHTNTILFVRQGAQTFPLKRQFGVHMVECGQARQVSLQGGSWHGCASS